MGLAVSSALERGWEVLPIYDTPWTRRSAIADMSCHKSRDGDMIGVLYTKGVRVNVPI